MTDVRPTLDKIDEVLAECDAGTLPAFAGPITKEQIAALYDVPVEYLEPMPAPAEPSPDPIRSRLRRWFGRRR